MLTTRSKAWSGKLAQIGCVAFLEPAIRQALLLRPPVPGFHEVSRDVHAQHLRAESRGGQSRRSVAATQVQDLHARS